MTDKWMPEAGQKNLTQDYIRECLEYDGSTGLFIWNIRPRRHFESDRAWKIFNKQYAGNPAGSKMATGYISIQLKKVRIRAHKLAWLYVYGSLPVGQIDHINHDRADNRIANLRVVTNQANGKNRSQHGDNKSGVTGVCWHKLKNKWAAFIGLDGKTKSLGNFDSFFDAVCARKSAELTHGFHANHGRNL